MVNVVRVGHTRGAMQREVAGVHVGRFKMQRVVRLGESFGETLDLAIGLRLGPAHSDSPPNWRST